MKAAYWVLTGLFCVALTMGGVTELLAVPMQVGAMKEIGFPLYMLQFLGVAKILGVAAVLYGKQGRLKEWAYAGFTFDLLGAAYAHGMSGNPKEAIPPLALLCLGAATYSLWKQSPTETSQTVSGLIREGGAR